MKPHFVINNAYKLSTKVFISITLIGRNLNLDNFGVCHSSTILFKLNIGLSYDEERKIFLVCLSYVYGTSLKNGIEYL